MVSLLSLVRVLLNDVLAASSTSLQNSGDTMHSDQTSSQSVTATHTLLLFGAFVAVAAPHMHSCPQQQRRRGLGFVMHEYSHNV